MIAAAVSAGANNDTKLSTPTRKKHHNKESISNGTNIVGSRLYGNHENLSKDNHEKCEEVFSQCDIDNSGAIDGTELLGMLLKLNVQIPIHHQKVVVRAMLNYLSKEESDEITLMEFKTLWSAYHDWKADKEASAPAMPFFPPVVGKHSKKLAVFLIFDDPSSCRLAQITSVLISKWCSSWVVDVGILFRV